MAGTLHSGKLAPHLELAKANGHGKPVYLLASNNDGSILVYCPSTSGTWTLTFSEILHMALDAGVAGPPPPKPEELEDAEEEKPEEKKEGSAEKDSKSKNKS